MSYSEDQKATALAALKANAGNVVKTARELNIPRGTLQSWQKGIGVNSEVLKSQQVKKAEIADRLEAIAHKIIDTLPSKMEEAKLGELATALGIAVDKMRLLRGESTQRMEHALSPEDRALRVAEIMARISERAQQNRTLEAE